MYQYIRHVVYHMAYWESAQPKFRKSQHTGIAFRGCCEESTVHVHQQAQKYTKYINVNGSQPGWLQ